MLCALASACASGPRRDAALGTPTLALLPPANQSVDLTAPDKVRSALAAALAERGYKLVPDDKVDAALKELGHTSGDTLGALRPSELQARVRADWYAFTTIEDFSFKTALALSQRKVSLKLRVVDALGAVVFEGEETGVNSSAGFQAAGDFGLHLAGKIARVDLAQETGEAVGRLVDALDKVPFSAK